MIKIRTARPDDASAFASVLQEAGMTALPEQVEFCFAHPAVMPFVAEDEGAVVGTCYATNYGGRSGWIGSLAVKPALQGRGIGGALLARGEAHLRQKGVQSLVLIATNKGRLLYERRGYVALGAFRAYAGHGLSSPAGCGVRLGALAPADWPAVEALDRSATGEERGAMLRAMEQGYVTRDPAGQVNGFWLPAPWGGGPMVATDPAAGRALLLQARSLNGGGPMVVRVASANREAVAELEGLGFALRTEEAYMVKGPAPEPRRPEWIWGMFSFGLG